MEKLEWVLKLMFQEEGEKLRLRFKQQSKFSYFIHAVDFFRRQPHSKDLCTVCCDC